MLTDNSKLRIGLLGIYHESNTFIQQKTTRKNFEEGHLFFGADIIEEYRHAFHEIGGIIERLSDSSFELIPIMYAEATPGGMIDLSTSRYLINLLMTKLKEALPLDALLVVPHGSAVSERDDDFDGQWLTMVRTVMGKTPIVGTLDPHANVSAKMSAAVDALIAYKTNPHVDQRQVGRDAADLMIRTLNKEVTPTQKLRSSTVAISIEQQYTSEEPCKSLYNLAHRLENDPEVLSVSILLGFPYADVFDMGSAFLVITNGDEKLAEKLTDQLESHLVTNRFKFDGDKISIDDALASIDDLSRPVLFLDMGDNVGGGSPGDGTFLLEALENRSDLRGFVCIYDPEAVENLKGMQINDSGILKIGAHSDTRHGKPIYCDVTLDAIVDGKFEESEPRHGGQVRFDMGDTAIVNSRNQTTIMLTSKRMVPFSLQQLLHFNIDPSTFDIIVAKGVQAPIAAYSPVCPSIVRVNTPGSTTADMRLLKYTRRKTPLFPFEPIEGV